ncbi:MAG: hypothetical protein QW673_00060, partial [Candidatus Thermoplasmatota archaeon]
MANPIPNNINKTEIKFILDELKILNTPIIFPKIIIKNPPAISIDKGCQAMNLKSPDTPLLIIFPPLF